VIKWYALCAKYHDHQINVGEMDGAFVMHEKERNCLHGFCMKPGGKKPLGRFEHNIETSGRISMDRQRSALHAAYDTAPQDHSQPQPTHPRRTPHAVGHGLILLMMGIMMPETC